MNLKMPKYKLKRNSYRKAHYRSNQIFEQLGDDNLNLSEDDCVASESKNCINNEFCLNVESVRDINVSRFTQETEPQGNFDNVNISVFGKQTLKENSDNFSQFMTKWATQFSICHVALNPLLSAINKYFGTNLLPSCSRTLLNTPRKLNIENIEPGSYFHFGVSDAVTKLLNKYKLINSLQSVNICVNIDGLPISKSNGSQLYPVLCNLHDNFSVVEVIGLYHGFAKPSDANSFLAHFIDEIVKLTKDGFLYNGRVYPFKLLGLICDAPAKSFVLFTKGHTGYSSCSKCYIEGDFVKSRICFSQTNNLRLRSDADFKQKIDEDHHTGTSLFESIPEFDMVKNIPLDPMHLIYLGVVRKLLFLWVYGKPPQKLPAIKISKISEMLIAHKAEMPCEFVRKPRSLFEIKHFKATEFRQFLCYTGPVVLKSVLSFDMYTNFLCLHVATVIFSRRDYLRELGEYAHTLLKYFIETFIVLYGEEHASHNVHNLIHLYEDTKIFGILESFSAFPFENYLQKLKRLIRKGDKPLAQIVKRKMEEDISQNESEIINGELATVTPKYEHSSGPVLENFQGCVQFKQFEFASFTLKRLNSDNCCALYDKSIISIENFVTKNDILFVIGRKYRKIEEFYLEPCRSSLINIFTVSDPGELSAWNINEIKCKLVKMSYKSKFIVVPLLHSN